jgi:mRNA-degrading endonuclease RelE of RelBE toxin-antitoxin system
MPVEYDRKAEKDLRSVPRDDRERLYDRLETIARDPYGQHLSVKPLKGVHGVYRERAGRWRAIFTILPNGTVKVLRILPRREDTYR